ncbi:MAG TPA: serine/threonine-protein kinase [Polyangiaceae bacterium]|jgi:serine/threonine protein kinase|nr:serine/threonine-protein kinase [Polyangiaceae bacterium]
MDPTPTKHTVDLRREVKRCAVCKQRFSRDAGFCPFDGTKLEPAPFDPMADPLIGARIDERYDVVCLLGEGGMGRIYEVRHMALERAFAMKILRPELAQDSELAARFILEAKATASVKHPNVVQITDFGRMPDRTPFFVMELLVGHTLGEVLKAGGPLPVGRAVRIIRKVAGALAAAHAAGVVHRDLKPDNVFLVGGSRDVAAPDDPDRSRSLAMLSSAADVRVVDFGAAKIVGGNRLTRAGVVFGTPHYMSPEQASGQSVDHRADVYSLGVIMYEMFCGRVPFEAETYMGVLTQHMFARPPRPSEVAGAARELGALEDITMTCLAKKPEDRFASMDALIGGIDRVVQLDGEADTDLGPRPSSRPEAISRSFRPAMPDEIELPTFDEMRGALAGSRSSWPHPGRRPWRYALYAAAAGGLVLATIGAARWIFTSLARGGPAEPGTETWASPPPTMPSTPPARTEETPPPVPPAAASSAPSVGERTPTPPRPAPQTNRHPPPVRTELDDVGDPFKR